MTFSNKRKHCDEKTVRIFVRQMVSALKYCHDKNIIHRDLKLGNLLLTKNCDNIKLGDFGLSSRLEYRTQRRRTICGTPNYIAPEIISAKTTHSFEVDVWSLGVIVYFLLVGHPPFQSKDIKETYRKIKFCDFKIPRSSKLSEEAQDLIRVMLDKDSSKRATLEELNTHPFVTDKRRLEPPLKLNYVEEVQRMKEDSKMPDYEETPFNESLNSSNRIELTKKAFHNQPPTTGPTNQNDLGALESNIESNKIPKVWVVKCVDYSSKYGLGYLLSNGHVGTFFNDKTKMLLSPKGNKFMYIYYDEEGGETIKKYNVKKTPSTLDKKFRLLENFKDYLLDTYKDVEFNKGSFSDKVYVKKWIRSRNAFAFKLPDKVVQVLFNDESEIRMAGKPNKIVSYLSKTGTLTHITLEGALASKDEELKKRLNYAKKIIAELLKR